MTILLDPQIFSQKYGGISRYFTEVWSRFKVNPNVKINCELIYSENLHLKEKKITPRFSNYFKIQNQQLKRIISLTQRLLTIKSILTKEFDVFVPTYYNPYFLKFIGNRPFVLTVYDMIDELYLNYLPDNQTVEWKRILIEKSTKIISISHSTKNDILRIYPQINENKIEVVHLSHSIDLNSISKEVDWLPQNYLLFIGNRAIYKNFAFFIKSVHILFKEDLTLSILCGGGGKFTKEENELLLHYELRERVVQINFDDNQLFHLYNKAKAFIFPSEYEGFGIPVLEAMACGCPVILTYSSSFIEVAGEAGVFFENNNSDDLIDKIKKVIYDDKYREFIISKGRIQEKKFSWDLTAARCLEIYKSVI